jgi:hypothetical protein
MNEALRAAYDAAPGTTIKSVGMAPAPLPSIEDVEAAVSKSETSFIVLKSAHQEVDARTGKARAAGRSVSVVSDRGIYIFSIGKLGQKGVSLETIPPHTITSASLRKIMMLGTVVELVRAGNTDRLYACDQAQAEKWVAAVRELVSKPQGSSTTIVNEVDPLDQLKKLKDLLDAGILSQAEFDAKKTDIMNKI